MSWDIIVWTSENNTDDVPSSWATDEHKNKYLYPKNIKSSKIEKLKRQCNPPTDKYTYYELEATYKRTIDSYEEKEKYLDILAYTSNIDSDTDGGHLDSTTQPVIITPSERVDNYVKEDEICLQFRTIIGMLAKIEFKVNELQQQIHYLQMKINTSNTNTTSFTNEEFPLPIKSFDELEVFENSVSTKKDCLIKNISLVGGNTLRHYITLMLKKLLTKDLALEYSAKGRKGKKKFVETKLYPLLLDAVRIRYPLATDTEVAQCVGFGLACAKDWDGGNKRIKNRNTVNLEDVQE
ncbi:hypothetical protein FQR65_LT19527 [Abscondita terminalis]|nr:hypothetical protein FQR65_LT19527 [Abscondita terminalis]